MSAPLPSSDLLATQIAALRAIMPPLDAFGTSGSYSGANADAYSDLDFLLVVSDEDFWPFAREFPALITHPAPVVSEGLGRFNSDYGLGFFYLLEGGVKVEYYVNAPATMTPLPLSARARIIEDRSGHLTSYLEQARRAFAEDVRPHVAEGVHQCLVVLHDLRKYASRGDLLPLLWKLGALRRPALALHHLAAGDFYAPSSAVQRLRRRVSPELARAVAATVPTLEPAAVADAFETVRALMLDSWREFEPLGVPTPEQVALEELLSTETIAFLRAGG